MTLQYTIFCLSTALSLVLSFSPQTQLSMSSSSSVMHSSDKPFALNVKVMVQPDKRDEWLQNIQDDQRCSRRDEEGCLQFSLSEDTDSPNTFYLHEQYVDEAAFHAHTQTPHFKRYDEYCKSKNPLVKEPEVFMFSPLDEGSEWSKGKRNIPKTAYCVTVNLYPKDEVREEFLKVIGNNKKGTDETEPLALQYTYGESTSIPNVFHFHEQYAGEDGGKSGFDAHASSPHFMDWESFVGTEYVSIMYLCVSCSSFAMLITQNLFSIIYSYSPFVKAPEVYFSRIIE